MDQEDTKYPLIKEEQEELWSSQEGEQLQGLKEADTTKLLFTPVPVKSDDDEEKPWLSQKNQRPAEQRETGVDEEDCGKAEPDRYLQPMAEVKAEDTEESSDSDSLNETLAHPSDLNSVENIKDNRQKTDGKSHCCSGCGKTFQIKWELTRHTKVHTGEKPFSCSTCSKRFDQKGHLRTDMIPTGVDKPLRGSQCGQRPKCSLENHTPHPREQKPLRCRVSDHRFSRYDQLNTQRCVGGQASEFHAHQSEEKREAETRANGEDSGEPEPEKHLLMEIKTEDSDDDCKETTRHQSGLNSVKNEDISHSAALFDSDRKQDKSNDNFCRRNFLDTRSGEKLFSVPEFKIKSIEREDLGTGILLYTGAKQEESEPSLIKDEQEEIRISHADTISSPHTPVPVKSDDEETPRPSQLHQRLTKEMETGADEDNGRGPEPDRESEPKTPLQSETDESSEPETEDSDDWGETRGYHSGLKSVENVKRKRRQTDEKSYDCPDCGETSETKSELTLHMRIHIKEKTFSCSVCSKTFNHKGNLSSHMLIHTGDKPFSCSVCGKRFNQKGHLSTHMLLHTGDKPFSCSVCHKRFYQKGHLSSHILVHTEERPFGCPDCGQRFKRRFNLKLHIAHHREQASALSHNQTELDRDAELGFEKEDCGGPDLPTSEQKQGLTVHTGTHFSKKLLSCSVCNKRFKQKGHLITHMFIHTGEKPFSCSVCSKGFRQKGHLTTHMLLHTGEKPFSCSFCNKRFNTEGSLKRHMMGHTGEKPLSCSRCGEGFSWSYQLKKHQCIGGQA